MIKVTFSALFALLVSLIPVQITHAQTLLAPQDSSYLIFPYYTLTLTPTTDTTTDPALTDPSTTTATDPSVTTDPTRTSTTTDPATNTTSTTTEPTPTDAASEPTPTEPTGMFVPPADTTEPAGTSATTSDTPVFTDSATLFVPPETTEPAPEREPVPGREPLEPRDCPAQTICPSSREIIERTVPTIVQRQWGSARILFLGAGGGLIVWLLVTWLLNNSRLTRELGALERKRRFAAENKRINKLKDAHEEMSASIADIMEKIMQSKPPSPREIQAYKKAGAELELFGSEDTRRAYNHLLKVIQNNPSEKTFTEASRKFYSALKKDLGLT